MLSIHRTLNPKEDYFSSILCFHEFAVLNSKPPLIPILNNTSLTSIASLFLVAIQSHGVCLQSSYLKMYLKIFGFFMRDE